MVKLYHQPLKIDTNKYQLDFVEFQKNLPVGDFQLHEDYGEWTYLVDVAKEIKNDIAKLEHLNGKIA